MQKDGRRLLYGIDGVAAMLHLELLIYSFVLSHEHKIAGVAYLMSQWFKLE